MARWFVIVLACVGTAHCSDRASAWNSIGHMAIAKLAYDELEAKHQLALYKLLKRHPHHDAYLAASRPAEIENEVEWVVMRSAVWPDWIRPRKKDDRGDVSKYHRGEDHYITVPFIDPKDEKRLSVKDLVNADVPNIVTALKARANDLKTKTASAEDRAIAACWLFHLVGDIHQPLHNASYFSSAKAFAKGDLGGNKFGIRADGRKWRLHTFWDDLLGADRDYADESKDHQAHLYREALKVAANLRGLKLPKTDEDKLAQNLTFESWSREGHELARTVAYQKSDGSGILKAVEVKFNAAVPDGAEEVGKEYIQTARAAAERQAVLAARRLAARVRLVLPS